MFKSREVWKLASIYASLKVGQGILLCTSINHVISNLQLENTWPHRLQTWWYQSAMTTIIAHKVSSTKLKVILDFIPWGELVFHKCVFVRAVFRNALTRFIPSAAICSVELVSRPWPKIYSRSKQLCRLPWNCPVQELPQVDRGNRTQLVKIK